MRSILLVLNKAFGKVLVTVLAGELWAGKANPYLEWVSLQGDGNLGCMSEAPEESVKCLRSDCILDQ